MEQTITRTRLEKVRWKADDGEKSHESTAALILLRRDVIERSGSS
jgi:hypothetical protein